MVTVITFAIAIALAITIVGLLRHYVPLVSKYQATIRRYEYESRIRAGSNNNRIVDDVPEPIVKNDGQYNVGYSAALTEVHGLLEWAKTNNVGVGTEDNHIVLRYAKIIFAKLSVQTGVLYVFKPGTRKGRPVGNLDELQKVLVVLQDMENHFAPQEENPFNA